MRKFVLSPDMLTMGGVFYPTGYMVVMFPQAADAESTGAALIDLGFTYDEVFSVDPSTTRKEISRTDDGADIPLPSLGTEGATVRAFDQLASQGHHGLIVLAESAEDTERAMEVVRRVPFSLAQKYRKLVIEDLK